MKIIEFAHICLYGVFVPMEHPSKFSTMCISQYLQSVMHHIYSRRSRPESIMLVAEVPHKTPLIAVVHNLLPS